jgi:hypothetical protein
VGIYCHTIKIDIINSTIIINVGIVLDYFRSDHIYIYILDFELTNDSLKDFTNMPYFIILI